jgi:hypothetical protein
MKQFDVLLSGRKLLSCKVLNHKENCAIFQRNDPYLERNIGILPVLSLDVFNTS